MLKRFYLFLLVTMCFNGVAAQDTTGNITWSLRKLEWPDFREQVSYDKYPYKLAKTHWNFYFNIDDKAFIAERKPVKVTIIAFFVPGLSWVRNPASATRLTLAHEQLHFDLVELCARELRRAISEMTWDSLTYKKQLGKLYKRTFGDLSKLQRKYDDETSGGTNFPAQAEWMERTRLLLEKSVAFSHHLIEVPVATGITPSP